LLKVALKHQKSINFIYWFNLFLMYIDLICLLVFEHPYAVYYCYHFAIFFFVDIQ
jgi:hypothetical protein